MFFVAVQNICNLVVLSILVFFYSCQRGGDRHTHRHWPKGRFSDNIFTKSLSKILKSSVGARRRPAY